VISHRFAVILCFAAAGLAADAGSVPRAAARMEDATAKLQEPLASEFRRLAGQALEYKYPDLAKRFQSAPMRQPPRRFAGEVPPQIDGIRKRMSQMRGLATDADRAQLAMALAGDISALPAGVPKVATALSLSNLSTEGDLGMQALTAVAGALGEALHETVGSAAGYVQLARLIRYEHVPAPISDPSLDAAASLLELHDAVLQQTGFSLAGLDGKTYSLDGLRGKVVLLNFWATWCPPCRREMPDLEKLYQTLGPQGFIVLAVSDEERGTVEKFLEGKGYTFPILLDAGREVNTAFQVQGIPQSFVFDRQGKLVAQSIDMRTGPQFRAMLKQAGLD
jgi:thiol-disulfide isomerase/thioredoxin